MNAEYFKKFFEGPFPTRTAAIRGTARIHGEKSLVVGERDGAFWGRPWHEENFRAGNWPQGFECVSRFDVGVAIMPQMSLSFDHNHSLDGFLPPTNMTFANWLKGERVAPSAGSRHDFRRLND
jgi:hypothetical protein